VKHGELGVDGASKIDNIVIVEVDFNP
jgi:hypothetical protein